MRLASNEENRILHEYKMNDEQFERLIEALTESRTNIQEKENDSHSKQCTEWEPQVGEVCQFSDDGEEWRSSTFSYTEDGKFRASNGWLWHHCRPYVSPREKELERFLETAERTNRCLKDQLAEKQSPKTFIKGIYVHPKIMEEYQALEAEVERLTILVGRCNCLSMDDYTATLEQLKEEAE